MIVLSTLPLCLSLSLLAYSSEAARDVEIIRVFDTRNNKQEDETPARNFLPSAS
jgi:hypothetical protein